MLVFAYFLNKRMKTAFKRNRVRIGEINAQIEDNLSGIRVVKSFANEDIECESLKREMMPSLRQRKTVIIIWEHTMPVLQHLQL